MIWEKPRAKIRAMISLYEGGGDPAMKLWENNTFAGSETTECRPAIKARTDALLYYLGTLPYK